ncbi:30S ribosomal protein S18 [Candidatus Phycorickettsia trachydisci]|uniref:Small ribosomal subunit protein bS18 n=1 Tax=Candidatus Phycorickettsia trachydisci TaxID=2115978 RepID=A0A2P1PA37_9RICK|nr:30S ribosomal protein S18 [Candidatus Phycorickettsia trachydisci]AVP88119.1 30S ribosomal protein S18 [Candidatus Phycorickettsia trachydisci]
MSEDLKALPEKATQRVADRANKKVFFRKRSGCPLHEDKDLNITYKNSEFLSKFISEGGRILGARITGVCPKHQKEITQSIKIARMLALMPFVTKFD